MTNLPNPKAISLPAPPRGAGVWLVPAGSDKTPQRVWGWGVGLSPTTKLTLEVKWVFFLVLFCLFFVFSIEEKTENFIHREENETQTPFGESNTVMEP